MTEIDRACAAPALVPVHIGVAIVSIEAAYHACADPATRIQIAAIHNASADLLNKLRGAA